MFCLLRVVSFGEGSWQPCRACLLGEGVLTVMQEQQGRGTLLNLGDMGWLSGREMQFITIEPPFLFLNWFSSQHSAFSELPITELCFLKELNALIVNLRNVR